IACTHCHTAMYLGGNPSDKTWGFYHGRMISLFTDLAQFAFEDLKPATMKVSRGELHDVGFIRRFKMKDGSLRTNPGYLNPNIQEYDGIQDPMLQLVRFEREGGKEIVLINFSTHPDVVGGTLYSPDWPGYTVDVMKGALGGGSEVVMVNGFGGDSNHCNRFGPKPTVSGCEFAKRMARKVAGEALKVYDNATEIPVGKIAGFSELATFEKNPHEPWEEPIAQAIVDCKVLTEKDLPDELRAHKMSLKKAHRIIGNMKHEGDFQVTIFGLQVGSLCFIGFPGEPFCETGMDIKKGSKMEMTICSCRTNGSEGYFPTRRAFDGAGYERDYTRFGPNCSEKLTEAALRIIDRMEL
ncbi:MAG: hypothetical protein IJC26_00985, partial [Clostridia bacterium]|nr:hypothetical protein [Clostridia bacterium]